MHEFTPDLDNSQRVLVALKQARARLEAAERAVAEPIAVIGIGCRFPGGADGPDEYWRLLLDGFDATTEIPRDRYDVNAYYDSRPGLPGKIYAREGAFLPAVDRFDAAFFAISPREAANLDPQQRLLLEVAWEALEHAGQAPDQLRGSRSGVFVGIGRSDYVNRLLRAAPEFLTAWHATGNGLCYGPGRLAHVLDLNGPNMAIDTACSSSLVAIHLACQSLRLRECDLALAGGCHVHLSPQIAIMLSMSRALAADGRCKTFDAAADGFGQGEGCGIIVLRRLSDALGRRDNILALIRGSAVNHDGHSSGLTVPNQAAQEQVVRDALASARAAPREIGYVEAHGTGTALGDPIEVEALAAVFCRDRPHADPLRLGSVKTNVGHLEAAAGIAGLIKVVLSLRHQQIPPHLHLREPNPRIAWDDLPIRIPTRPVAWQRGAKPRLAGVSSFGMSGTNSHIVLQEAPVAAPSVNECERPIHAVALSARSLPALREQARRLETHLALHEDLPLADVAFTANTGRTHFPVRVGLVSASTAELSRGLSAVASGETGPVILPEEDPEPPGVVFLCSGQGSQYFAMARQLYATQPVIRHVLDRCDTILRPLLQASLCEVLFDANDGRLDQTLYTQPALFALEYAMAELWRSWGVVPRAVLGHSVGEYAAACIGGVFTLEEGLRLVAERSRLMQALSGGRMAAVFASESLVRQAIGASGEDASVAAINGAANVVIAGSDRALRAVLARLEAEAIGFRELTVSHAFHSAMMDPVLTAFATAAGNVNYAAPRIELISNVTGRLHKEAPTAKYWTDHLRETVRFADGLDTLVRRGHRIFVEIGPGNALVTIARCHFGDLSPLLLPSMLRGKQEWGPLLETLARLYEHGVGIDWTGFDRDYRRQRVPLPTYPFERQRFWCDEADDVVSPRQSEHIPAYRLRWQDDTGSLPRRDERKREAGYWIIFADHDGIGERLGHLLEAHDQACVYVTAGNAIARVSPTRWIVNPELPADFSRLIEDMAQFAACAGIVFAWSCQGSRAAEPSADELMASQMHSCGGALRLIQALAMRGECKVPLWLLTRNAVAERSGRPEVPDLSHASIWGMGKTVALEYPEFWGGMIDLPDQADDDALMQALLVLETERGEDYILTSGGRRFVARLEPFNGPAAAPVAMRSDACYLITGGLGDLGLHVARWMVDRGARHVVLMGRREPSPAARAAIADLRRRRATVTTVSADAAEAADVRRLFAQIAASLPPLRGLVHAAGVEGHAAFADLDGPALERVLRPKVMGAWLLHEQTSGLDLDFFVCFSSIAALWGSKGQAHYAAANAFLDALAHYRRRRGLPALSIGWGPWEGGGMAGPAARNRLARLGIGSLNPDDALRALERSLSCGEAQIAIADVNWERFRELYALGRKRPLLENIALAETGEIARPPQFPRRLDAEFGHLSATERRDWLLAHLQHEVSAVLGRSEAEPPDVRTGFFRLGMDSLMAVDLTDRLARDFQVPLSATLIFNHPTIAELAAHLAKEALGWEPPAPAARYIHTPASDAPAADPHLPTAIAKKLARLETLVREI
jgi:acyl transferase domain-containing protein/acyl carrier protein